MRTTVRLDDSTLGELKRLAAKKGTTLTAMLEKAVREMLTRERQPNKKRRVRLPTFKGHGLQAGVDLDDAAALLELMERDE